jgi:SpoVK/Ycf46/Vps4 family AAA+-type ATPase
MKGLLMVGLPGCGKDLTKKIASSVLGKSLLDLDFGSVMGEGGGVIGSSAMTIKRALSIATTLKGILGISEFEKAVGGLESSAKTDGGETARTIAYLLNWMQEQSDVFVIGTANDVRGLAAEQTRQGRFSHIVFVDLPTTEDRREIFAVHLHKRGRAPENFDLDELAEVTQGHSGAEIEAAIKAGLLRAFMDREREVTTADIVDRAKQIQPTSLIKREQVESLRNWARDHMAISAAGSELTPFNERLQAERALEM